MEKNMFKKLLLLITYAVVLVAAIVKLDDVLGWLTQFMLAFQPLLIGFAIAFILHRPCQFFARVYERYLPRMCKRAACPLAVATSYLIIITVVGLLVSLVVPELVRSIQTFINNMSTYAVNLQSLYDQLVSILDLKLLADLNLTDTINNNLRNLLSSVLNTLTNTLPHLVSVTSGLLSGIVTGVLAIVFSIYMLSSGAKLTAQCRRLAVTYLPRRLSGQILSVTHLTCDTFTKYISGQLTEACILGFLCFLGMCLFRFDYALLISVVVGVSALIPVAGAYLGASVAALLLIMIDPLQALWFLVFLVILQQLEGNIIYPRVVGTSLGLPGIWVLAAVTVGGSLLGLAGVIVSVPVTAVLYTLLKQDLRTRVAVNTGKDKEESPPDLS